MNTLIQVIIFTTEALAMYLTQQSNKDLQKYSPIIGLLGEPFWIYTSYISEQWGILGLSIIYTYIWLLGYYNYWVVTTTEK